MTIFIGDSESLRTCHHSQSRLRGLISIALMHTPSFRQIEFPR
jgi:hypothetical protein